MKERFLDELTKILKEYEVSDISEIITYFDEMIEDAKDSGLTEEAIIKGLGSIEEIALVLKGREDTNDEDEEDGVYSAYNEGNRRVFNAPLSSLRQISIDLADDDVVVSETEDNLFYFYYSDFDDENTYFIEYTGTKFKVKTGLKSFVAELFKRKDKHSVELVIPKSYKGDLKIETSSGDIDIANIRSREMKIETVSGDIDILDVITKETKIENVSGTVKVSTVDTGKFKIESVSGDIKVSKIVSNTIKFDSVSGSIEADIKAEFIKAETVSGDIEINIAGEKSEYAIKVTSPSDIYKERTYLKDDKYIKIDTVSGKVLYYFKD